MEYEIWENILKKEAMQQGITIGEERTKERVFNMLLKENMISTEQLEELKKKLEKDKDS